ncbi:hypothetical protein [Fimbriiglobus ruber]|nr:hypothetical protein [Fimbriiglobus ruber]
MTTLIDGLAKIDAPKMGYSNLPSYSLFLPLDDFSPAVLSLYSHSSPESTDAMRELVKLGVVAVPFLVDHLDDKRPTVIRPIVMFQNSGSIYFNGVRNVNATHSADDCYGSCRA